jgi:hypothetical protein
MDEFMKTPQIRGKILIHCNIFTFPMDDAITFSFSFLKHRHLATFPSSREMISWPGIEPLITPFGLGASPLYLIV